MKKLAEDVENKMSEKASKVEMASEAEIVEQQKLHEMMTRQVKRQETGGAAK